MVSISDFDSDDIGSSPVSITNIEAFQFVGYPIWIGEDAGSSPVSYTKYSHRLKV